MKKITILTVSLLLFMQGYSQNKIKDEINFCLIMGKAIQNPFQGFGITDTNRTVEVIVNWKRQSDTNHVSFDKAGRITYLKTFYEEAWLEYQKTKTIKRIKLNPQTYCRDTNILFEYRYDEYGYISTIKESCAEMSKEYTLKHTLIPIGRLTETFENGKLIQSDVFIFNKDGSFFQWETVTNHLIILKYKRDAFRVVARLENIAKYNEVQIENVRPFQYVYSLLDRAGNEVGAIHIKR